MQRMRVGVGRRSVLVAVAVGGTAALMWSRPSRGQEPVPMPALNTVVPAATTTRTRTVVKYEFSLPPGARMVEYPRVRTVGEKGEVGELLPLLMVQHHPTWAGHRELHIGGYKPGRYDVTVELAFQHADGKRQKVVSPVKKLLVSAASPASP